ncbi:Glycoside hydrolase, family 71 [Penicillium expansum]|uniref:Glycoside hydrolase, family 71 n=1 Tax=Penicillium expansum TaxID=27334 RepID=A0A0A2IEC3_PENEN|nr:Glycoside hydrolase, family 71 [Penicillium expansum]KGO38630.1 Glycoside hydrolase, family 71 [Penicillium expansum]KGO59466.1 Glycoside hydrolase, family 71 [Penicillium expansum]
MPSSFQWWHYMLLLSCLFHTQVYSRAVFAHFMVSNTAVYGVSDWETEIQLAKDAHIDAFALNIAKGEETTSTSMPNAFKAAENLKFSLFFSFDYAGNGAWDKDDVLSLLTQYVSSSAYYLHGKTPLVSTFEGPGNADDWVYLKSKMSLFFVPDWSSVGAKPAMALGDGVADGLFSWAAWPNGPNDMNTYVDASYMQYLGKKPYMMPISPWFFTNMPGYDKNWVWRGDDLWYTRWEQALYLAPEFIEIISWNDYGESHYIGPTVDYHNHLADSMYAAFETGHAPYNYVENLDHTGWRQFLPYLIDLYKFNHTTSGKEGLVTWYRLNAAGACADGGTTANTVSQLQLEYWPKDVMQDKIFYSALLSQPGDISVTIDGVNLGATWTNTPSGNVGIYHGSVSFAGHSGDVMLSVTTPSGLLEVEGKDISSDCYMGNLVENWNAWVGYTMGNSLSGTSPDLAKEVCIEGWGMGDFNGLCQFACSLGYCPVGACVCTKLGPHPTLPKPTGVVGYPAAGKSANYAGLFSPFTPDTCVSGTGEGELTGLCSFACNFGYCPIYNCTCTATGPLNVPPAQNTSIVGWAPDTEDNGLCSFACTRDYCPSPVCLNTTPDDDPCGNGDDDSDECSGTFPCDFSINYSSLNDLEADLDKLTPYCVDFYMLGALYGELETTLANYTNIAHTTDYDKDFEEYSTYMKNQVLPQLRYFMNSSEIIGEPSGVGNQFFDFEYLGSVDQEHIVYYDIIDREGFFGNLTANVGVEPDWVTLDGGLFLGSQQNAYYEKCAWWQGFPVPAEEIKVTDPREVMRNALPNIPNLQLSISLTQLSIASGGFDGVIDDVIQTISTAVSTLSELVDRIYHVVELGRKLSDIDRKKKILKIIGGVFLALPFLGPLSGLGDVIEGFDAILTLAGNAANEGYDVYTMVQDPESAPVAILGMLLGFDSGSAVGKISDESLGALKYESLAASRREMKSAEVQGVGDVFKEKMNRVNSIVSKCSRR